MHSVSGFRRSFRVRLFASVLAAASFCAGANAQSAHPASAVVDNASAVYPFLGVDWGGNVFVGSALPFGMVKLGPDMENFDGRRSGFGYMSGGQILGFSHLHLSGAQGKYGNILVMPVTGVLDVNDVRTPRTAEVNTVGYYAAQLSRYNVKAELTSTRRVGVHRYTFTRATPQAHIIVDVASCLGKGPGAESQKFLGAEAHVTSATSAEGVARFTGGWNEGGEYKVYYAIQLDTPAQNVETWSGAITPPQPDKRTPFGTPPPPPTPVRLSGARDVVVDGDGPIGISFNYAAKQDQAVQMKVGISFLSAAQARANIQAEAPGWNFDGVHQAAVAAWNKAFSTVELKDAAPVERRKIYTAMYHTMLMPADRTGENPDWQSSEPYYDDFQAIWDTFRSSAPWLTLVAPDRERDMVRSLIDTYRHTGYMPDARVGNANGRTQGGSNANVMVADAWIKGLRGIDYATAYQSMLKDANVPPQNAQTEGRGGLEDYNKLGYITPKDERAGSRTVEYSYDDFGIAELACGLHHEDDAKTFLHRAHNWENLWDPTMTAGGFKGFLRPRNADGTWGTPYLVIRGTWPDFMYEGDIWTYSYYAPQDVARIIEKTGGTQMFLWRMDTLFYRGHFDVSNEPGFLLPVLYNWAGRPDKTADAVTLLLEKFFTDGRSGIPGNDDSGAMSSWMLFQTIGFYPVSGQDVYVIGSPSLPDVSITLGNGKRLHIVTHNLDSEKLNHYVQSVTLNGRPWTKNWFRHSDIENGGTLVFTMGSAPSNWGITDLPPSMSDAHVDDCKSLSEMQGGAMSQVSGSSR